jgi:phosphate transport system substrate-binding protein
MKKILVSIIAVLTLTASLFSCQSESSVIDVITREEGSGTRSAFVELMKITDSNGNDAIKDSAESTSSTAVMITTVAGDKNAIGYVSLGSLSSDVKAVLIDGAAATAENVKNGSYPLVRPFNIAYKADSLSELAADFIMYIMSAEGQQLTSSDGYIAIDESAASYTSSGLTGKITLAGSTSVSPLMEKLADAYMAVNSGVTIEIQQSGSSAGITSVTEGACDIGMASRELKDSEAAALTCKTIAQDGIAVIVNKENSVNKLTSEQIKNIYLGSIKDWSEIGG